MTGAADVWALGVILYKMLAQVHPFHGADQTIEAIARRIVLTPEPPPLPKSVNIPQELSQLVISMLDAEASKRPTGEQIVEALSKLLQRKGGQLLGKTSPFRGLHPFSERHADLFFGRSAEIEMAIERLRHEPILPVVGPSGAGKSSFVAAGIVPRLRELDRWLVLKVRPGTDPFGSLVSVIQAGWKGHVGPTTSPSNANAPIIVLKDAETKTAETPGRKALVQKVEETLEATNPELPIMAKNQSTPEGEFVLELQSLAESTQSKILLFVDQLEELYTQAHAPNLRRAYMETIARAADDPEGPIRVVLTLREDFLSRVAESSTAQETLSHIMVLRAPDEEALLETVKKPVELVGYHYEDESLPQEMLNAVKDTPSSLPLLQFACSQLWNRRDSDNRLLTRAAYTAIGGVEGALAIKADELLAGLSEVQQTLLKQLVLRLVTPEGTRRVKSLSAKNSVYSIALSPDSKLLASAGSGKNVEVIETKTGKIIREFFGHKSVIFSIIFSHDGNSMYSASWDYTVRRYRLDGPSVNGQSIARHLGNIYSIDVHDSIAEILGTPSADRTAKIWKVDTDDVITLQGHQGEVNSLRFSPDGTRAATVSDDGTVRLWDTRTGRPLWRAPLMIEETSLLFTHQGWTRFDGDLAPLPSSKNWQKAVAARGKLASVTVDGQTLCLATFGDELEIWDIPNDEIAEKNRPPGIQQILAIRAGCLSLADKILTLTQKTGEAVELGQQVDTMNRFDDSVFVLHNGKVRILDIDNNEKDAFTLTTGASSVMIVGAKVALGFPDGRIEVWTRNESGVQRDLDCRDVESSSVTTIVPGPPGTIIVGFANGSVGIWSLETGERLYSQRLHGPVLHLLHQDRKLWAATELGSTLQLDLSMFYREYCELMERVWNSVPWIWEEGRARFRERPRDHVCADVP